MNQHLANIAVGILAAVRQWTLEDRPASRMVRRLGPPFGSWNHQAWARAVELWRAHGADLVARLPTRPCPACGSSKHEWLFNSYDDYPFHECLQCGTWFVPHHVDEATFQPFRQRCPEAAALLEHKLHQRQHADHAAQDVRRITDYLHELAPLRACGSTTNRYLDIGCGVGHSLRAATALGLEAHGVEVNPTALTLARSKGFSVFASDTELPPLRFGLISCLETLEHVADPRALLARFCPRLDTHGVLLLTVPNLNAPAVRLLRGDCPWVFGGLHAAGHINLFHLDALRQLLNSLGMTILDADGQYGHDWFEIVAYVLGLHRGARDYRTGQEVRPVWSSALEACITMLGPSGSLLERLTLTAPLLKVIACRRESTDHLQSAMHWVKQQRLKAIRAEAERQLAAWHGSELSSTIVAKPAASRWSYVVRAIVQVGRRLLSPILRA